MGAALPEKPTALRRGELSRSVFPGEHSGDFALSNNYTSGSGDGASDNNRELISHREGRVSINTGQLSAAGPVRSYPGSFDFESILLALRELFALDRQVASQPDSSRCGIC